MTGLPEEMYWPASRVAEAMTLLSRRAGFAVAKAEPPPPPEELSAAGDEGFGSWIEAAAEWIGLEAEPMETPYAEVARLLRGGGPALLRPAGDGRFLAIVGGTHKRIRLLAPDLETHTFRLEQVRSALCSALEAPLVAEIDRLLGDAGVRARRRERARAVLLAERLVEARIGGCWILRLSPHAGLWTQARHAGLPRRLATLIGAHLAQNALWILSWWMVGRGAMQDRLDHGWLIAWALVLLTLLPFRVLATWSAGVFSIDAGGLLKQRLLAGALALDVEETRQQGVGQHLGQVMESEVFEALATSGAYLAILSVLELITAAVVLGMGAGGGLQVLLLLGWTAVPLALGWRYYRRRLRWTEQRLEMTHDLVERMVGHRTRLAQEARARWHDQEDQATERYVELQRDMDRAATALRAGVPRGWLLVGIVGLLPTLVAGTGSASAVAIALGGMLLAYRAFGKLATGLPHVAGAALAWKHCLPLVRAAARAQPTGAAAFAEAMRAGRPNEAATLLEANELVYRYRAGAKPVLRGCGLRIRAGDRLLLEGPSGGGKSTLGMLLAGLRLPESGLLLLGGLDRRTLGTDWWRRRVVAAPQFHENHVVSGTLAFNLLMGRRWPPRAEDLVEAEVVCRALDLGALLDRMPAGLQQMVGETGWQLSHGERSRLYLARALLQGAEIVVLDESFAALDPETLRHSLRCVLDRTSTLMVIAHP